MPRKLQFKQIISFGFSFQYQWLFKCCHSNACVISFGSVARQFRATRLASRRLSSRCSARYNTQPCIIQALAGSFVVSQEVVYHTQETVLKTRNATQSAPLSCPSCVSSKDHLLAAHESLREENRALLRWDTHDRSIQALDLMGLTHGAFCFYGGIASFFHVWEINFMKGLVVWVFLSSCYYLHLSWFFASSISANILSVNPKWEKPGRNEKWICFFLLLLIPESKEKSPQNYFFFLH